MSRQTFKKQITTPELIAEINPKNLKLIEMFLKDKNRSCSNETIKKYRSDLNIFFVWNELYNDNKHFPDIKRREVSDFFSYCVDELKWQGKRFARVKSAISSFSTVFCKYYYEDYPTYHNFINEVIESIPKDPVRKKTILTDEQVDNLLKWLTKKEKYCEACLFALAVYSGCRISELEQMTTDLIDENCTAFEGMFLATTAEIRCKGKGKNGHMLTKFILKEPFLPYYHNWINQRSAIIKETKSNTNALFIKPDGKAANKDTFDRWREGWEDYLSGTYKQDITLYFHCLRHKLVTDLVKLNLSKDFIVYLIGWKSAEMCDIYTDIDNRDRKWEDVGILKAALESKKKK